MKKYEKEKNILILFMLSYTFIYYTLLFLVECVHLIFFYSLAAMCDIHIVF